MKQANSNANTQDTKVAKFKVLSQTDTQQRSAGANSTFRLQVIEIEGSVSPEMSFIAYCTHHPFEVWIRAVERYETSITICCETTWPVYEEMFDLAVIDSARLFRKDRFFFDHDDRYSLTAL